MPDPWCVELYENFSDYDQKPYTITGRLPT